MSTPFPIRPVDGHPGILTIIMEPNKGPMVVLDQGLIERLDATLSALPADCRGVVLASGSDRVFVAGADLSAIQSLDDGALHRYLEFGSRVFGRLSQLPFPTAAAIGGAALGGGLELAMHCDGLIGAPNPSGKPYPVGLPESGLSICPGWGGTNLLPARIDPAEAIRCTATGQTMPVDQAISVGLFDAVAPTAADLIPTAAAWVAATHVAPRVDRDGSPSRWIGRMTGNCRFKAAAVATAIHKVRDDLPRTGSSEAVVHCIDIGLAQGWEAALAAERNHLVRLRSTPKGKAAIEAFFAKSRK